MNTARGRRCRPACAARARAAGRRRAGRRPRSVAARRRSTGGCRSRTAGRARSSKRLLEPPVERARRSRPLVWAAGCRSASRLQRDRELEVLAREIQHPALRLPASSPPRAARPAARPRRRSRTRASGSPCPSGARRRRRSSTACRITQRHDHDQQRAAEQAARHDPRQAAPRWAAARLGRLAARPENIAFTTLGQEMIGVGADRARACAGAGRSGCRSPDRSR